MNCPYCDSALSPQVAQCPHCGAAVASTLESAQKLELYNPNTAALWSLLLSPIFGAYVVKRNWKILGQEQQAKRSGIWLITLLAVGLGIGCLFPNASGVSSALLLIWYFLECRPQKKYLVDNKIDYQEKGWTPLVLKAIGILVGVVVLLCIVGLLLLDGEPSLDCSSPQAFEESAKEIIEYVQEDIGAEELSRKIENGDSLTESEEKELTRFSNMCQFLNHVRLTETFPTEIDGMSASDLLDYVDK